MKTIELDTEEARDKRAAAIDASRRNANNKSKFAGRGREVARLRTQLNEVYNYTAIYTNYRDNCITVKMSDAVVRNRAALDKFEREWTTNAITKAVTNQGIIYRIPE